MENKIKSSPKDVFAHLLTIVALYISAINFLVLIFQYINLAFPDPLEGFYYGGIAGAIRWSMASLIIVFPVYLWMTRFLMREYAENPEKRELKIRKWLVYFTLFVAAVTIIGDLVTLVYNFLGGELTARFTLKITSVLAVASLVFWYYLRELRDAWKRRELRILAWAVSLVVLCAVVFGFFTAGSPFRARLVRFDERRVNDLQILQSEIINYWSRKDVLPATLDELKSDITGFRVPRDPKTQEAYSYGVKDKLKFELCALFDLPSDSILGGRTSRTYPVYGPYGDNWEHTQGNVCFERTIDPTLYGKDGSGRPKPLPL
jgi:hypothetical protein